MRCGRRDLLGGYSLSPLPPLLPLLCFSPLSPAEAQRDAVKGHRVSLCVSELLSAELAAALTFSASSLPQNLYNRTSQPLDPLLFESDFKMYIEDVGHSCFRTHNSVQSHLR